MKQYNSWDEIDKDTGGLVTSLTYIVLFVNDQVYNFEMQLSDHIKGCGLYRQKVKMLVNSMDRQMAAYNRQICRTAGVNAEAMALITQSMEDDIKPHIDRYGFTVSHWLTIPFSISPWIRCCTLQGSLQIPLPPKRYMWIWMSCQKLQTLFRP